MLESLKEDRRLSMSHWRYRLLHWSFGIEVTDGKPPVSELPPCLYTHYCPLFHLTNIIALLLPVLIACRLLMLLGKAALGGAALLVDLFERSKGESAAPTRESEIAMIWQICKISNYSSFERFWMVNQFVVLSKEEAEIEYNKAVDFAKEETERRETRERKSKQNIIFWVNFSRAFFKMAINLAYVVIFAGAIYLAYKVSSWIDLVAIFSFIVAASAFIAYALLIMAIAFGAAFVLLYVIPRKYIAKGAIPIALIGDITCACLAWIKRGFDKGCSFISVFYEENCPAIILAKEGGDDA